MSEENRFKLVPVEAAREQLAAGLEEFNKPGSGIASVYAAMVAAAPVPPQVEAQPVAIVGRDWQLLWFSPAGMETHAALCERTGLEIGDKLYREVHSDAGEVERLTALCLEKDERMSAINKSWADCIAERDTLRAQLAELISAVRSMNYGPKHAMQIHGDDETCYPQRKEWAEWILGLCDAATKEGKGDE